MGQTKNNRRSSARIASDRARRGRKTRSSREGANRRTDSIAPKRSTRKAPAKRSRTSARRTQAPARQGEFYKTARLAIIVFAMAAIGFLVVVGMDTLGRKNGDKRQDYISAQAKKEKVKTREDVASRAKESALQVFWDKLVDRFWDNDLPEVKAASKKTPVKKKAATLKAKKVPKKAAPLLPDTKSKRADIKPPKAQAYTKNTEPLKSAEKKRVAETKNQRARLDAILNSVGIDGIR